MKGRNQLVRGMSGVIENMVAVSDYDGYTIFRSRPNVLNDANSESQQRLRGAVPDFAHLGSLLKPFLDNYWIKENKRISGYNTFMKMSAVNSGDETKFIKKIAERGRIVNGLGDSKDQLTPAQVSNGENRYFKKIAENRVIIGNGKLGSLFAEAQIGQGVVSEGGLVSVTWNWDYKGATANRKANDKVYLLWYNLWEYQYSFEDTGAIREEKTVELQIPVGEYGYTGIGLIALDESTGMISTEARCYGIDTEGVIVPMPVNVEDEHSNEGV